MTKYGLITGDFTFLPYPLMDLGEITGKICDPSWRVLAKWVELAPLPAQKAELTAEAFLKHFVSTFDCPLQVHTDQGRKMI